jgi:hypothetical protein
MRRIIFVLLLMTLSFKSAKAQTTNNDTFQSFEFINETRGVPCLSFFGDSLTVSVYKDTGEEILEFSWKEEGHKYLKKQMRDKKLRIDYTMFNGYIIHTTGYNRFGTPKNHFCFFINRNSLKIEEVEICVIE